MRIENLPETNMPRTARAAHGGHCRGLSCWARVVLASRHLQALYISVDSLRAVHMNGRRECLVGHVNVASGTEADGVQQPYFARRVHQAT